MDQFAEKDSRIKVIHKDNTGLWSHINRINTLDELADVLHLPLQDLYLYLPGTFARNKEEPIFPARN